METASKQKILDLNFEEDSSEEELPPLKKELENTVSKRYGPNRGVELKFNSNLMRRGIFQQEDDDYHNSAIMTFPEPQFEKKIIEKKVQSKPRQISKEEFDQISQRQKGIQIVYEIIHENQSKQITLQEESKKQEKTVQFQDFSHIQPNLEVNSSIRSSILNIELEQSSSQSDIDTNGDEYDYHSQTIKLLALRPHQREKVAFEEIALTHDPFENMLMFSNKQIPMGKIINLHINRNQTGLNYLWPQFELFCERGAPMLYSRKMMANTTSNYYITVKKDVSQINDPFFIAKLRGNFSGSVYQVYSKGINPKKGEANKKVRAIEATIKFKQQSANMQPREFQVYTLAANTKYHDLQGVNFGQQLGLDQLFKLQKNKDKIFQFQNRKPIYSQAVEGFILNFGGRVQKASVKNFILQDSIAHREVLMLGKIDEDKFRVDISWPMKPYVAYCVCLANFDSKFTSE